MKDKFLMFGIISVLFLIGGIAISESLTRNEYNEATEINNWDYDRATGCYYQSNSLYSNDWDSKQCEGNWETRNYCRVKYFNDEDIDMPKEAESKLMQWDGKQLIKIDDGVFENPDCK